MSDSREMNLRDGILEFSDGTGDHSLKVKDLDIGWDFKNGNFSLGGHSINYSDEDTIQCNHCDQSFEVPEIMKMSSAFNEIVYKIYLYGKLKNTNCNKSNGMSHGKRAGNLPGSLVTTPNNVSYSGTIAVEGDDADRMAGIVKDQARSMNTNRIR